MPFLTYKVNNEFLENYESVDIKSFNKFLIDIEDLNCSKKAILVDEKNNSILNQIKKIQDIISKNTINNNLLQTLNVLLVDAYRVFGLSNKIQNSKEIIIDFVKDRTSEIDRILKKKIIKGQYNYNDFDGDAEILKKKFFDKIKYFINSQNDKKKKIDEIYIFHKELGKMLLPIIKGGKRLVIKKYKGKDGTVYEKKKYLSQTNLNNNLQDYLDDYYLCKNENINAIFNYTKNLNIIRNSIDLILNWWLSFDKEKVPNKINIISDIPECLQDENDKNIIIAEKLINNFLFNTLINFKIDNIHPSFKFIDRLEFKNIPELKYSEEVWTHKRHFIFGANQSFVFSSQFGVEIISEKNSRKVRQKTVLEVEDDEKDIHLFHLKYLIPYFDKKLKNN